MDASSNNNLKVHIVENTGHMPGIMMMEKLMDGIDMIRVLHFRFMMIRVN